MLRQYNVTGLIVAPVGSQQDIDSYQNLRNDGVPFVFVCSIKEKASASAVLTDAGLGAHRLARYLLDREYREWAYLTGRPGDSQSEAHSAGLRSVWNESGRSWQAMPREVAGSSEDDGYRAAQKLLAKSKPNVIIAANDTVAVGAYRYLKEIGIKVPEEVALVGFGDLKNMDILEVPLTTVRENLTMIGEKAFELLLDEATQPGRPPTTVFVEPELVVRQSA